MSELEELTMAAFNTLIDADMHSKATSVHASSARTNTQTNGGDDDDDSGDIFGNQGTSYSTEYIYICSNHPTGNLVHADGIMTNTLAGSEPEPEVKVRVYVGAITGRLDQGRHREDLLLH